MPYETSFSAAQFTQRAASDLFYPHNGGTLTSFIKVNFLELAPAKDGKNEKPSVQEQDSKVHHSDIPPYISSPEVNANVSQ